jgi:hypothetical protein
VTEASGEHAGREIAERAKRAHAGAAGRHDRLIGISEAVVLSAVALIAAWSGFSAAKWSTESELKLSGASTTHTKASRAFDRALTYRVGDATTFNAWFGAVISGHPEAAAVAKRRFRPAYRAAFDAWLATKPFTNPDAPPGPQSMPQYKPTGQAQAVRLDAEADSLFAEGEHAAEHSDNYVRTTVILGSVLFLVGISAHFPIRGARIGLLGVSVALLVFAIVLILSLPGPP